MARQSTDDPRTTVSVKVSESIKEQYQDAVSGSMSADLRAYIRSRGESGSVSGRQPPTDDQALRNGYQALLTAVIQYAPPDSRRITVDRANTEVAQATGLPKDGLKRRIFRPLESRGYISVAGGNMIIHGGESRE